MLRAGLSSRTVRRRIEEMSDNVHDSLKTRISTLVAFSLALDKSTDVKDTAQLAVFIRRVTADLNVCEEFLQLVPLRGTTTGKDIFDAMLQCVEQYSLDFSRLVCVTTDGAPAMTGQKKGAASLLVRHCEAAGHTQPIHKMHCIIHQEALCAKSANLVDVMSVVVKVVNSILSRRPTDHHLALPGGPPEVLVDWGHGTALISSPAEIATDPMIGRANQRIIVSNDNRFMGCQPLPN